MAPTSVGKPTGKPNSEEMLPSYSEALHYCLVVEQDLSPPPYSPLPRMSPRKQTQLTSPLQQPPPYYDVDPVRAAALALKGDRIKRIYHGKTAPSSPQFSPNGRFHKLRVSLRR